MTPFDCPNCEGRGYEVEEHMRIVPEHHPSCTGNCGSDCPVPVPSPEYERVPCPSCGGSGIDPELVEVAMKAIYGHYKEAPKQTRDA